MVGSYLLLCFRYIKTKEDINICKTQVECFTWRYFNSCNPEGTFFSLLFSRCISLTRGMLARLPFSISVILLFPRPSLKMIIKCINPWADDMIQLVENTTKLEIFVYMFRKRYSMLSFNNLFQDAIALSSSASLVAQVVKRLLAMQRPEFDPWVGKIPWRRKWQPTPVLLPGKSHGQRSLVGYIPWVRKESDMTERLHFHFHFLSTSENFLTYVQQKEHLESVLLLIPSFISETEW